MCPLDHLKNNKCFPQSRLVKGIIEEEELWLHECVLPLQNLKTFFLCLSKFFKSPKKIKTKGLLQNKRKSLKFDNLIFKAKKCLCLVYPNLRKGKGFRTVPDSLSFYEYNPILN